MRYLAIDHGTKHCGVAVLDNGELQNYAAINLYAPYPQTLPELGGMVCNLIQIHRPGIVVLEKPMQLRGGNVAQMLIEHYAICKFMAVDNAITVMEVSPPTMKLHVAGSGKASKDDVAWAVSKRFNVPFDEIAIPVLYKEKKRAGKLKERLYDTADAIGLAWAASEMSKATVIAT